MLGKLRGSGVWVPAHCHHCHHHPDYNCHDNYVKITKSSFLHEWCVCLHQQLVQRDHLGEGFCVNGNHGNQIYRIKMEKFMIKTSLHKEKISRSKISRKGKFCALRFHGYIFWWFFDDWYNLYKNTDPLLENSAYTVFGLVLPEVASQTNVAAELK